MKSTPEFPLADLTVTMMREVFEAISSTALEQARAYSEIAGQVGMPLDAYVLKIVGYTEIEQMATVREYVKGIVLPLLSLPSSPTPDPLLFLDEGNQTLRDHFNGIIVTGALISDKIAAVGSHWSIFRSDLDAFVLAKLKGEATRSYHQINALLRTGMPNIIVTGGQICTKVTMRVSDEVQTKASLGAKSVSPGKSLVGLRVRVADERSVTSTKSTEIVGSIRIDFRTGTFPPLDLAKFTG
ncbi:hypothetical protein ACNOYE_31120 [Nannocystaceae bacterium ST9]